MHATSALLVVSEVIAASIWEGPSRTIDAIVALAGILVAVTILGMREARAMTSLRRILIANQSDGSMANSLRRGRRLANALRGFMALITLAIVILGAWIVTR